MVWTTGPTFEPQDGENPDAGSPRADDMYGARDMLSIVAGLDREINRLSAAKAVPLDLAHKAHIERTASSLASASLSDGTSRNGARFDSLVLGER
jgi:hypothetical protein